MSIEKIKLAMERGNLEEVKTLLKDLPKGGIDQRDENQMTLLCRAMLMGNEGMVKLLVESGADLYAVSVAENMRNGPLEFQPLNFCVLLLMMSSLKPEKSHMTAPAKRILQYLIDLGISVDQKDSEGMTAAERAVKYGVPQVAEDLKAMALAKKEKELLMQAISQTNQEEVREKSSEPRRCL